jgi:hypothetical protein
MKILIATVGIPKQFLKQKFLEFLLLSSEALFYIHSMVLLERGLKIPR